MCVQLRGATGTNTAGVEKVRERENSSKIRSHKAGSGYAKTIEKKKHLSVNGAQSKDAGNMCFVAAYFRRKSAYTVNRKALKC